MHTRQELLGVCGWERWRWGQGAPSGFRLNKWMAPSLKWGTRHPKGESSAGAQMLERNHNSLSRC